MASLIAWVVLMLVTKAVNRVWSSRPTPSWAQKHFGSPDAKPEVVTLNATLRLYQLCGSTTVCILWVYKSYVREETPAVYIIECLCCLVFIAHLFYALVNSAWDVGYVTGIEGFIDAFTITPLLMQGMGGSWLTLAYLRCYRMNTAFTRLVGTGVLDPHMSELSVVYIKKLIEFIMVIMLIAGTMFVLEGLGDIPHFADRFLTSGMGSISFFQSTRTVCCAPWFLQERSVHAVMISHRKYLAQCHTNLACVRAVPHSDVLFFHHDVNGGVRRLFADHGVQPVLLLLFRRGRRSFLFSFVQ